MSDEYAYIGRKRCGCVVAATVDSVERPDITARDVADFVKSGYSVERVPVQWVRDNFCGCKCKEVNQ